MAKHWDGEKLVRFRGSKTQHDLATELRQRGFGTTQTTVSRWESGQVPQTAVLSALADVLGVSIEELLDDESEAASMAAGSPLQRSLDELLDAIQPFAILLNAAMQRSQA